MVELLIGILLTSMIFLAASSLVVTLFTSNTRTKQLDEVQQVKNDLMNELSNAIKWSGTVEVMGNDLMVITFTDDLGNQTTYTYSHDTINDILNKRVDSGPDEPIHSSGVKVSTFTIKDFSVTKTANSPKSLEIFIELEDAQLTQIKDAFRIVASQRAVE